MVYIDGKGEVAVVKWCDLREARVTLTVGMYSTCRECSLKFRKSSCLARHRGLVAHSLCLSVLRGLFLSVGLTMVVGQVGGGIKIK